MLHPRYTFDTASSCGSAAATSLALAEAARIVGIAGVALTALVLLDLQLSATSETSTGKV